MTTLLLIRHAPHVLQDQVMVGRTPGVALSAAGREAATALARRLAAMKIDAVLTSPRRRARETAHAIAQGAALTCEVMPDLDEVDFGGWTGATPEALERDPRWHVWNARRSVARCPGGESMDDIWTRTQRALRIAARRWPAGVVALVTHAEPIRAALLHCRGIPFDRFHEVEIAPASISALTLSHGRLSQAAPDRVAA